MKNTQPGPLLPYRGSFGDPRPLRMRTLPLPPAPMPSRHRLRPLKAWRYVGIYGPELMLCIACVRVGPGRQAFWALWDRERQRLHERTTLRGAGIWCRAGRVRVLDRTVQLDLRLQETLGIETVSRAGASYAWTRKQGDVAATGTIEIDGRPRRFAGRGVIDDTAAYYPRHTEWRWCAGVGSAADGRAVAWNLVVGVNDPETDSERTVWLDGCPHEAPPSRFADDLSSVDQLLFRSEAVRQRSENLVLLRSRYRQPFGTFSGHLPGGILLSEGYGVMEHHEAWW